MNVWFAPDAEPMTSQGTETNELLGNGMWLVICSTLKISKSTLYRYVSMHGNRHARE